jgi:hypothetical protein
MLIGSNGSCASLNLLGSDSSQLTQSVFREHFINISSDKYKFQCVEQVHCEVNWSKIILKTVVYENLNFKTNIL